MKEPAIPVSSGGTELTRFNALKHGVLSRYTVLPWEDPEEYRALVDALAAEHAPQGPTEEHLVEELTGILWRKRRLRLAEAAAHRRGLERALGSYRETAKVAVVHLYGTTHRSETATDAVRSNPAGRDAEIEDVQENEAMTRRALDILRSKRNDSYEKALAALRTDTQEWWAEMLECDDEPENGECQFRADVESLRRFLEREVLPWFDNRRRELASRPLVRDQAFGESLEPDKLEKLGRYEVHLDRKLERTLAMLIKLKELRGGRAEA